MWLLYYPIIWDYNNSYKDPYLTTIAMECHKCVCRGSTGDGASWLKKSPKPKETPGKESAVNLQENAVSLHFIS